MTGAVSPKWASRSRRMIAWLLISACFVGIPAMLFFVAVDRYCQVIEHEGKVELRLSLQQALNEVRLGIDIERYISQKFDQQLTSFSESKASDSDIIAWLKGEQALLENSFKYLIWDMEGRIIANDTTKNVNSEDWREVARELAFSCYANNRGAKQNSYKPGKPIDLGCVRRILGPQYVSRMAEDCAHPKHYMFGWADSAMKTPLFWANSYRERVYLFLFDPAFVKSDICAKLQLQKFAQNRPQNFGVFRPDGDVSGLWATKPHETPHQLLAQLRQMAKEDEALREGEDEFLATAFLTPEISVFAGIKKFYSPVQRTFYPLSAAILFTVLMLPFLVYSWRITISGRPGSISIMPRIAFIFFFASAIPFMALSFFAREHYSQKRDASLKETHRRALALLQNYDERLQSMWSRAEYNTKKYLEDWIKNMNGQEINEKSNKMLAQTCRDLFVESYYLVASTSALTGTYNGVERLSERLEQQGRESDSGKVDASGKKTYNSSNTQNAQIANVIGKRIMSELNGEIRSTKETDRLELLFESLLQKSFSEITHSFIKAMGGLSPLGFGRSTNQALINFMSASDGKKIDVMALMLWNSDTVQEAYLQKTISEINRNPLGLKIIICSLIQDRFYPSEQEIPEILKSYFNRIVIQPTEEIDILSIGGQEFMALGFIGKHLSRYKIMGLYPIDRLDRMISGQRTDLFLLAFFCLILAAWLAQMLSQSFLDPLNSLQNAAQAIEKRNFSHRVGDMGKDEFGETAAIFDEVMVGLGELEVAKVVQESLFPQDALNRGRFRIYGKSLAMAELGGDYFDYFPVDNGHVAALLGDVAGHGVGAALIMAMAKAGIVKCQAQLNAPVQLLEKLHQLIYGSKTRKQKKIMTFQYLTADVESGKAIYANAGGCSPIFCRNGKAEEITLAGAALGAFKKTKFQQHEIVFESGDLLVFYTDGIIEARNRDGEELGYTNFARLVEKSVDSNPKEVYARICDGYSSHITDQEAQDDLTLVVICYN